MSLAIIRGGLIEKQSSKIQIIIGIVIITIITTTITIIISRKDYCNWTIGRGIKMVVARGYKLWANRKSWVNK